ncbi:hypothetical protein K28_05970, partial [Klebsiella pneumoniae]
DNADIDFVMECAKRCNIHDEIIKMPMGYETIVGELGLGISGGQKQRILIARALYRRPSILFMDEATSHLDLKIVVGDKSVYFSIKHHQDYCRSPAIDDCLCRSRYRPVADKDPLASLKGET